MFGWLVALAGAGTVGHICMTRAYAAADVSVVLPFDFAKLPFTALIAFMAFAEVPTIWTWIGGAVIFARSEEHTSELQSLMRISYAVFCLKKKLMINVYNASADRPQNIHTHTLS